MKTEIKNYANARFLHTQAEKVGLHHSVIQVDYDRLLKDEVSKLLPQHPKEGVEGRVDAIETCGVSMDRDNYFPENSFYRVSVIYSGRDGLYFRNCTVHFTSEMEFMSVQGHHKKEMEELFGQIAQIFSSLS